MRYTRIQRNNYGGIITIGEYIEATQPHVFFGLNLMMTKILPKRTRDVTECILAAADISGIDKRYARIMQERPHPGIGGLLKGEKGL